jgi:hypothetical protein
MHVNFLYHGLWCVFTALFGDPNFGREAVMTLFKRTILSGLSAYTMDLLAITAFGVVPFSRCPPKGGGRDVFQHHIPAMVVMSCKLCFAFGWDEPMTSLATKHPITTGMVLLQAVGYGGITSLNELIMCMQRVDFPRGLWHLRVVYTFELGYKCLIFSLFGALYLMAAARVFMSVVTDSTCAAQCFNSLVLCYARCLGLSPFCWGCLVGTTFPILLYPSMLKRAGTKLHGVLTHRVDPTPPLGPHHHEA